MTDAAIRTFVAIELSSQLQQALWRLIADLKEPAGPAIRWVTPHNIHLTLKFLGYVSPTNLSTLVNAIDAEALRHKPFELTIGTLGAFPNKNRPRIVWVGVQAPAVLNELQHGLDRETNRLGYPSDDRGFSPHLTLGRTSQHANATESKQIADAINTTVVGEIGRVSVESLRLFRSDLQPGGAIYTSLHSALLKG